MNDQIICPHCKKSIPLSQALSHEIREKLQKENLLEIEKEKQRLNEEARKWRTLQEQKMREQEQKKEKEIENRIKRELDFQLKDSKNESEELKKQNRTLQQQQLELNRLIRQLKTDNEKRQLEMEKKLAEEQDKIRNEEKKRIDDEYRLKILEKDKKLSDALKMAEEYKRKLEQGSQQLQGEVLELELENILKTEFPYDEIREVPKGVTGADILQVVKNNFGKVCGKIIWEFKRTKTWSDGWILKLNEDKRVAKADIAVIISQVLPDGIKNFSIINEVFVGNYNSIVGLTMLLRVSLIKLAAIRSSEVGKQEKKEILWNYFTSIEFQHRFEAIKQAIDQKEEILRKEKDWFRKKWAFEEKSIQLMKDNFLGMHGDLQAIIGRSLPEIKGLDVLPEGKKLGSDKLF